MYYIDYVCSPCTIQAWGKNVHEVKTTLQGRAGRDLTLSPTKYLLLLATKVSNKDREAFVEDAIDGFFVFMKC